MMYSPETPEQEVACLNCNDNGCEDCFSDESRAVLELVASWDPDQLPAIPEDVEVIDDIPFSTNA